MYSITFIEEGYWSVVATGALSRNSAWLANQRLLEFLGQKRDVRMVIDLRAVDGRPDMITSILQAERLVKQQHMHTHRIAVIDLECNETWMQDEMLCLSNRGLPVRFFTREAEAIRWIVT